MRPNATVHPGRAHTGGLHLRPDFARHSSRVTPTEPVGGAEGLSRRHRLAALGLWLSATALLIAEPLLGQPKEPPSRAAQGQEQQPAQPSSESPSGAGRLEEAAEAPVINIQELPSPQGGGPLYAIELRNADVADVFRIFAHDYHLNLLVDNGVTGRVTASFTGIGLQEALDAIAQMNHLTMTREGNILKLVPHVVNVVTKTFTLQHVAATTILNDSTGAPTIHDLLSDQGKVLLGAQPNSIMVIDYPDRLAQVEAFLSMADRRMTSRVFTLKYLSAETLLGETPASSSETKSSSSLSTGASSGAASPGATSTNGY